MNCLCHLSSFPYQFSIFDESDSDMGGREAGGGGGVVDSPVSVTDVNDRIIYGSKPNLVSSNWLKRIS